MVGVDGVASASHSQTVAAWSTISSRLRYFGLTPPIHEKGRVRSLHGALWATPITAVAVALPPADGTRHSRGPAGSGVATPQVCDLWSGHSTGLGTPGYEVSCGLHIRKQRTTNGAQATCRVSAYLATRRSTWLLGYASGWSG